MHKFVQFSGGFFIALMLPIIAAGLIAAVQGIHFDTIIYSIIKGIGFYNTYYQIGIAVNIGVFFLLMRRPHLIYFSRGWLLATVLNAFWTIIIDFKWFT